MPHFCVLRSIWQQGTSPHKQQRQNGIGSNIGFLRFLKHLRFPGAFGDGRGGQIPGHFQLGLGQLHLPLSLLPQGKEVLGFLAKTGLLNSDTFNPAQINSTFLYPYFLKVRRIGSLGGGQVPGPFNLAWVDSTFLYPYFLKVRKYWDSWRRPGYWTPSTRHRSTPHASILTSSR